MKILFQLFVLLVGIVYSTAVLRVDLDLVSYSNPTSEDCDGGNCEGVLGGTCDNRFSFCVREVGSFLCLVTLTSTSDIEDDSFTFSTAELGDLGLGNPMRFNSVQAARALEIFVEITDVDTLSGDDNIDRITIPIPDNLRADGQQSPLQTYFGACGRANIAVRFNITSECPPNTYGPQCNRQCVDTGGQRFCNYLGEPTCLGNFQPPDCITCKTGFQGADCTMCAPNYYPAGVCTKLCVPRDDPTGHFTCNKNGDIVCLSGYKDTENDCRMCIGNFREPDCIGCDDRFTGVNCDTCVENYYPQGICTRFCMARNDSLGHYICNSNGEIVCLPGYTDSTTNCVRCTGNRREPDCAVCNGNFQLPTCTTCTPKYTGTSCNVCAGNFREPDCIECDDNFVGANCDTCAPNYYPPGECFCTPRNDSSRGRYTCDPVTGERICLEGYMDPDSLCLQSTGSKPTASSGGSSSGSDFLGSTAFIAIIAIVIAIPTGAFFLILCVLCVLCLLSSNVDCSCPKIDCEDCCSSFFSALSCGLKCDDLNPLVICLFVILGVLAAPAIILIGAVVVPIFLVGACLLYTIAHMCD